MLPEYRGNRSMPLFFILKARRVFVANNIANKDLLINRILGLSPGYRVEALFDLDFRNGAGFTIFLGEAYSL